MWKARLQERESGEGGTGVLEVLESDTEEQRPKSTSGSEPERAPDNEWSLASFLATKAKRGRLLMMAPSASDVGCSALTLRNAMKHAMKPPSPLRRRNMLLAVQIMD